MTPDKSAIKRVEDIRANNKSVIMPDETQLFLLRAFDMMREISLEQNRVFNRAIKDWDATAIIDNEFNRRMNHPQQ